MNRHLMSLLPALMGGSDSSSDSEESVLTEPVSHASDSEDEAMPPLRLEPDLDLPPDTPDGNRRDNVHAQLQRRLQQQRRRPLQDLPLQPQSTVARLARRVQEACAAAGSRPGDGDNSPQLNPLRQLQVAQQEQRRLQQAPQQEQRRLQQAPQQAAPPQPQQPHQGEDLGDDNQENIPVDAAGRPLRYCCKECPARFSHKNFVSRHVAERHPVTKPFPCPGCGRGYVSREVMEAHFLMVHQGERPYPCDQCDKVFSRREYLLTHSRVHTGARPYTCPMAECGRQFAWRGSYDYHIRTHTGERPYACMYCYKDFRDSTTLKLHEMIHTNSFPYPCTQCNRKFRRSYYLREHTEDHAIYDAKRKLTVEPVQAEEEQAQDGGVGDGDGVGGVSRAEEEAAVAAVALVETA